MDDWRPIPVRAGNSAAGTTMASVAQYLIVIGLLVGVVLLAVQIKLNATAIMTISRIKQYDHAVRQFRGQYGALPGDIRDARTRLLNCLQLPCAAMGNGDNMIADRKVLLNSPFYFRDTSENRTFWLHMAVAGLISGVKVDGSRSQYFGQWGVEFPAAPFGAAGGFHIAYYSVSSTTYSPLSLFGHYMVLRGATDTYGAGAAPYALTAKISSIIDKKMDDGRAASGRVAAVGSTDCQVKGIYNLQKDVRSCNMLFQLSF